MSCCCYFGSKAQWGVVYIYIYIYIYIHTHTYIQGYADNICLLPVGKFPNTVSGLMQWALHTVDIRCDEVGLSVNPDKTRLVVFTRRRKLPGFFGPHFLRVNLRRSMSVKYLGIVLDCRLTWRELVDVKVRRLVICCGPVGGPVMQCEV